jgi:hypothetical protein
MCPFIGIWAEERVEVNGITKDHHAHENIDRNRSAESHVHCGIQLQEHSPRTCCLSSHYSTHYLVQKWLQTLCILQNRNFWNLHYTHWIWTHLCDIQFGMRDGVVSAVKHSVTSISRTDTAGGVRHLPQMWQHVYNVARGYIVCKVTVLEINFANFWTVLP